MANISFVSLWERVMNEDIFIEDIIKYKDQFNEYAFKVLSGKVLSDDSELEAFLRLCNDVYTYSPDGEVMIPDSIYDQCMQIYKSNGKSTIVFADTIGEKRWNFIKHEVPGCVGTLSKIYTYKELKNYLSKYIGVSKFILAPKYDGVSCVIKLKDGEIVSAATRYNGIMGQDITALVRHARNSNEFRTIPGYIDGFYKCELCVGTEAFNELIKLKKYKNRRSATTGIINTPTNINYAEFVTIIPLLYYNPKNKVMKYLAPGQKTVPYYSPADLMDDIESMLEEIRAEDFPFRVDGVVINPDRAKLPEPNEFDLMDNSIAFKVNSAEGKTKIEFGYMAVGRLGKGVPMVKVVPVEVNETIVTDVSLGSYDKFLSMDLHEGEEVIIYSAGDVIPQLKLPSMRANLYNAPELKIRRVCPYCNEKMTRVNTEYFCMNRDCPRIITGKIANFLDKMGLEGFSDKSVEMIYAELGIRSIHEFLNLNAAQIMKVPGFGITDATGLEASLKTLKNTPVAISKFFGSLGIDKISEKKCRKIFEYVNIEDLMNAKDKKLDKIYWELQCSDGIGAKTAKAFIDFIRENRHDIIDLLGDIKILGNIKYKANVVFTGFRPDKETENRFNALGIEIANSVSKSTLAVLASSTESNSTKSKAAIMKGIPIFHAFQLEDFLTDLESNGF